MYAIATTNQVNSELHSSTISMKIGSNKDTDTGVTSAVNVDTPPDALVDNRATGNKKEVHKLVVKGTPNVSLNSRLKLWLWQF